VSTEEVAYDILFFSSICPKRLIASLCGDGAFTNAHPGDRNALKEECFASSRAMR
jgi:hypothetical protein